MNIACNHPGDMVHELLSIAILKRIGNFECSIVAKQLVKNPTHCFGPGSVGKQPRCALGYQWIKTLSHGSIHHNDMTSG